MVTGAVRIRMKLGCPTSGRLLPEVGVSKRRGAAVYGDAAYRVSYSGLRWEEFYMKRMLSGLLAAGLLAGAFAITSPAFAQTKKEGSSMPKVGDTAPDFALKYSDGKDLKEVKLSDYRGKKNVVLAFYVFAFTGG